MSHMRHTVNATNSTAGTTEMKLHLKPGDNSPEAITAYPDSEYSDNPMGRLVKSSARTAFDAGVAATHAKQYAATRNDLFMLLWHTHKLSHVKATAICDALLATPGPLLDAAQVWEEGRKHGYEKQCDPWKGHCTSNPYRSSQTIDEARP